ncbi:DUF3310 domain-containing protein [Staphylococcus simulans]|uniref:DUF3310 domain-containing protein n=1 Tax=Staphylococcus simulans TaxID=1286 RepID=UPI0021D42737|nr:DUF3310 domain-containing protein [Staphylococcus simulans]UXR32328.1 DUF3310 domain-containing protein [Staphylococcus simulans]
MKVRDLNLNDRIIIWSDDGEEGKCGSVTAFSYKNFTQETASVLLDGEVNEIELTDRDYFDKLPISFKKAEHFEDYKNIPEHSEDSDSVNHPSHYNQSNIEVIDIMEALPSEYNYKTLISLSNVIKYIFRAPFKNGKEDLKKAQWYLQRAVNNFEGE